MLYLFEVLHNFVVDVDLELFVLNTVAYNVKDINCASRLDYVLKVNVMENSLGVRSNLDHVSQNALQILGYLLIVRGKADPVRIETHHAVEKRSRLSVLTLHFVVKNYHRLEVHFHEGLNGHIIDHPDELSKLLLVRMS